MGSWSIYCLYYYYYYLYVSKGQISHIITTKNRFKLVNCRHYYYYDRQTGQEINIGLAIHFRSDYSEVEFQSCETFTHPESNRLTYPITRITNPTKGFKV